MSILAKQLVPGDLVWALHEVENRALTGVVTSVTEHHVFVLWDDKVEEKYIIHRTTAFLSAKEAQDQVEAKNEQG